MVTVEDLPKELRNLCCTLRTEINALVVFMLCFEKIDYRENINQNKTSFPQIVKEDVSIEY